jgi:hypothetical protein
MVGIPADVACPVSAAPLEIRFAASENPIRWQLPQANVEAIRKAGEGA